MVKISSQFMCAIVLVAVWFAGCSAKQSVQPAAVLGDGAGELQISLGVVKPNTLAKVSKTSWNKLVIQISGADMDTLRDTSVLADTQIVTTRTLSSVKAGTGRKVAAWTLNASNGCRIHISVPQTADILENRTTHVTLTLQPAMGSIYFNFFEIDSRVDTVVALFCLPGDTLKTKSARLAGGKVLLALDYIPDNTSGEIRIFGIDYGTVPPDTLYRYQKQYLFQSNADSVFNASFTVSPGNLAFDVSIILPGVTVVEGYMNSKSVLDSVEKGPLFITEIMYGVDDSEYIELFNPGPLDLTFDTLLLEANSSIRKLTHVSIRAASYYVVSRKAQPFADTSLASVDLVSTGDFVAVREKDSTLIDCVYFTGSSNNEEWPVPGTGARASIVLDFPGGPLYNDFGRNWRIAESPLPGTGLKGTPGTGGR